MPKVSVICSSYNHEQFVEESMLSVVDQTFTDYEFLISDDGSSDRTCSIIEQTANKAGGGRITFSRTEENRGAVINTNELLSRAKGKYIAIMNSDDAWDRDKLQVQVDYLDSHPDMGAVFTLPRFIDASGKETRNAVDPFTSKNRTRHEWLNFFFNMGNSLCHPSMLIRRECYDSCGLYDPRYRSLPDLEMWTRLCMKYEIHIIARRLVDFRVHEANESNPESMGNHIRKRNENARILNNFCRLPLDGLQSVFPGSAGEFRHEELVPFYVAMQALDLKDSFAHAFAVNTVFDLMGDPEKAKLLEMSGFSYSSLHEMMTRYNYLNLKPKVKLRLIYILRKLRLFPLYNWLKQRRLIK